MATPDLPRSSYSLYKPLGDDLFLVRRTTDGEILLARPLDGGANSDDADAEHLRALIHHGAAHAAAQLLNHENLISIHDELVNIPGGAAPAPSAPIRMLLWDYPDAGTLQDVFDDYCPQAGAEMNYFDGSHGGGLLPESFVWHVALGLLRALQWLHEGVRDTYAVAAVVADGSSAGVDGEARFESPSRRRGRTYQRVRGQQTAADEGRDWWPVLHRDVTAGNVFLQRPRGVETYGAVKLGGFARCFVSGGAGRSRETPVVAMQDEDGVRAAVLRERLGRWKRDRLAVKRSERPYTQGSELFAVGALLYRMMCGRELPPADECPDCGCVHITCNEAKAKGACGHDCVGDINIDEVFKPLHGYTNPLKSLVALLLRLNHNDEWWASDVLDIAWEGFESWAAQTEDGRLYKDVFDDLWLRKQNQARLKQRQRRGQGELMQVDSTTLSFVSF